MTYANDVTGAYAALADLGDTPDEVATTLTERGVRGTRGDLYACPIAAFLTGLFPDCGARVDGNYTAFYGWEDGVEEDPWRPAEFITPAPVTGFIGGFDRGAYPHLEACNA